MRERTDGRCKVCGEELLVLFSSWYCKNDCDKKVTKEPEQEMPIEATGGATGSMSTITLASAISPTATTGGYGGWFISPVTASFVSVTGTFIWDGAALVPVV